MLLGILDELLGMVGPSLGLYVMFHESVREVVTGTLSQYCPRSSVQQWYSGPDGWAYYHLMLPRPDGEIGQSLQSLVAHAPDLIGAHWFDFHCELGWSEGVL